MSLRWYDDLSVHAKLIVMAMVVASLVSLLTVLGTAAVQTWRYRVTAAEETRTLASVLAENVSAAVVFGDATEANVILSTVSVRPNVRRACLYLTDSTLFAAFTRPGVTCSEQPTASETWARVSGVARVSRNAKDLGAIAVERDVPELWTTVAVSGGTGVLMILLGGLIAAPLAHRLHRRISGPIAELAEAVRQIPLDESVVRLPRIRAGVREVEDLAGAFDELLRRVSAASTERELLLIREQDASRLKDEFLAAVSHELRTPLNAIVGWVHILRTTTPPPDVLAKGIETIARNAKAQARVIEDLVDISRIVTGKLELRVSLVDLREVIEVSVDLCRTAALAKRITVSVSAPDSACLVSGDRERLQQVVGNLLSNALKFTETGGAVAIALQALPAHYELMVRDNSIGMSSEFVPFVFDRFRQADGSTRRRHGGLGLGLAIVKELTELHGGTVRAESPGPGLGATFSVHLPAVRATAISAAETTAPSFSSTRRPLEGTRILAVDDNEDALDVLTEVLRLAGAQVLVADSGVKALRMIEQERPDVLLCDLAMPDLDGFEVLNRLRAGRAGLLPAIALSAHAGEDRRAMSLQAGFREHIAKPFDADQLIDAIKRAWDGAPTDAARTGGARRGGSGDLSEEGT